MTESEVSAECAAKGLAAPRVTPADVDAAILSEHFFTAQHGVSGAMEALELHQSFRDTDTLTDKRSWNADALRLLTFCVLVLRNGFTVTGESACASPENFNAELGRKIAKDNARAKIWPLLGYALRNKLTAPEQPK